MLCCAHLLHRAAVFASDVFFLTSVRVYILQKRFQIACQLHWFFKLVEYLPRFLVFLVGSMWSCTEMQVWFGYAGCDTHLRIDRSALHVVVHTYVLDFVFVQ